MYLAIRPNSYCYVHSYQARAMRSPRSGIPSYVNLQIATFSLKPINFFDKVNLINVCNFADINEDVKWFSKDNFSLQFSFSFFMNDEQGSKQDIFR